jgi:hypothetical protein
VFQRPWWASVLDIFFRLIPAIVKNNFFRVWTCHSLKSSLPSDNIESLPFKQVFITMGKKTVSDTPEILQQVKIGNRI